MCKKEENLETEITTNNISYEYCLNCGTELKGKYCHVCGQQAANKTPTVIGFIMEYLNNAFIWDSKFFHTLWTMIRRPGHLTNEFLSGKFASHEHPLKLNMFLLFVFITLFLFCSGSEKMNVSVHTLTKDERVFSSLQLNFLMGNQESAEKIKGSSRDTVQLLAPLYLAENYPEIITNLETTEDTQGQSLDKWTAILPHVLIEDEIIVLDPTGYYRFNTEYRSEAKELEIINSVWSEMVNIITKYFPMIVLFTAPFLSISLSFVQRRKQLPHINHFIFSLHYTAFLEFLMVCIYILYLTVSPAIELLECILSIGTCTYLTIAFRRVYFTASWFEAILKALFTSLLYFIISLLIFIVIFLIACYIVGDMY